MKRRISKKGQIDRDRETSAEGLESAGGRDRHDPDSAGQAGDLQGLSGTPDADSESVEGPRQPGFIGFAVGRTDFWEPLVNYRANKMTREGAVAEIARRYRQFVNIFESARVKTTGAV
jgi:myo-inositol catabolism protein IolC